MINLADRLLLACRFKPGTHLNAYQGTIGTVHRCLHIRIVQGEECNVRRQVKAGRHIDALRCGRIQVPKSGVDHKSVAV